MSGPSPTMENDPQYIEKTLKVGYDVEVDVWLQADGFYLGHNTPLYKIERHFLQNQRIWSHCKNTDAFLELSKYIDINCFFQTTEELVLTSRGYLWAHSDCKSWNSKTVIVNLENKKLDTINIPFAICSDYVEEGATKATLPFDLLIIDIDGVMTDGTKIYDRSGKVSGKIYCDLDFTAIKRFKAAGIKVCFLSGDQIVNKEMAETRKIDFFHNPPGTDKVDMLSEIKKQFNTNRIVYVGDDYYDISIMKAVDLAFCPATSPAIVKRAAASLNINPGKGVIANLYDKFEDQIAYVFPIDSQDVNPK
jgi:3-deoxy-D-manno-octulosonate 8-phosphate phosphatase (KDO 8-P phosphatase)